MLSKSREVRRAHSSFNPITVEEALETYRAPAKNTPKVQFLRPPFVSGPNAVSVHAPPPLSVAYLAGMVREAGYQVGIIDAQGEAMASFASVPNTNLILHGLEAAAIIERIDPDAAILGVSLIFSQGWPLIRDLIVAIKRARPDLVIMLGGEHPTAIPEYILKDCPAVDYIVMGEGELTLLALIHRIALGGKADDIPGVACRTERGSIVVNGQGGRMRNIDAIPSPAWDLVPLDNYFAVGILAAAMHKQRALPILASRGCPYQCTFCSNPNMWTTRYTLRDPGKVVDEIVGLISRYGIEEVDFYDLTAIVKKDWIVAFCNELRSRRVHITWHLPSGTRSEALDEEVLALMWETGCRLLVYAPESGSKATLEAIKKRISPESMARSIRTAIGIGHNVKLNLVIGFPRESRWDVWRTLFLGWKLALVGVNDALFSTFSPYPGSALFDELRVQGRISELNDDYFAKLSSQYDLTAPVSYCEKIGKYELLLLRFVAFGVFYALSYFSHPSKLVSILYWAFSKGRGPSNLLEQRGMEFIYRTRMKRQAP